MGMEREDWEERERERRNEERLSEQERLAAEARERAFNNAREAWQNKALATVEMLAYANDDITTDDVWDSGLDQPPNDPRALGGVIVRAVSAGLIEDSGRMVKSRRRHGTKITVWRSKVKREVFV